MMIAWLNHFGDSLGKSSQKTGKTRLLGKSLSSIDISNRDSLSDLLTVRWVLAVRFPIGLDSTTSLTVSTRVYLSLFESIWVYSRIFRWVSMKYSSKLCWLEKILSNGDVRTPIPVRYFWPISPLRHLRESLILPRDFQKSIKVSWYEIL